MNTTKLRQHVSQKVRGLRTEKRYTQKELARRAGVSVDIIGKIERAETTPSLETLHGLCQALRISMAEFLSFETEGKDATDRVYRYLLSKKPEHVELAEKLVRVAMEHLEETK